MQAVVLDTVIHFHRLLFYSIVHIDQETQYLAVFSHVSTKIEHSSILISLMLDCRNETLAHGVIYI